jgi:hypothetical protein
MANGIFDSARKKIADGDIIFNTHQIQCILCTASYTPSTAHDFYNDITGEVAAGGGYTAGGVTLTGKSTVVDAVNHRCEFFADPVVWASPSSITARYAILLRYNADPSLAALLCWYDFTTNKVSDGGAFTVTFDAEGALQP